MDSNELDPCLAAEARMKESVISNKVKLLILIIGVVLMLILFGLGLFFLLRSTPTMEDLYDDPIPFVPSDLTGKNALYAEKNGISVTPITKFSPSTKTTERPPSSTTRSSHPGETIIALHSDKEYKKKEPVMRSMEILKTTRTSTTLPGPIEIPTTTTAPTTSAAPPPPTTTTSRGRTPSNRAGGAADSQPIVPTIPTNDLQSHPTNIPLTDDVRKSCLDHHRGGYSSSGIYKISPDGEEPFFVFCDMETDGGGWAVVQRRTSDEYKFESAYFDRYEPGFGSLRGNHWLGLAPMHRIAPAHEKPQTLRIELRGDTCTSKAGCSGSPDGFWWGEYEFALGNHESGYVLLVGEKEQRGNLTNPSCPKMTQWQVMSNGQPFSTFEKDRDQNKETNCAQMRNRGAWWHRDCTTLALNGRYGQPKNTQSGLFFFRDAPKNGYTVHPRETLMMLRPRL